MSQIAKVRFDKSTTFLDPKEEQYWVHFLANDDRDKTVSGYIRSQMRHNPQLRRELLHQPVCPRCEGFTFFHKGGAQCTKCGGWTPESQTHTAVQHIKGGFYK